MRSQKIKRIVHIGLILAASAMLLGFFSMMVNTSFMLSNEECVEDFDRLVKTIEETHPAFELGRMPTDYETQKQNIRALIMDMANQDDYTMLVSRYLTLLNDAHTKLIQPWVVDDYFLEIKPYALAKGDTLYVVSEDRREYEDEILTIGGIEVERIFETIDLYMPAENQTARDENHNVYATNKAILKLSGCAVEEESLMGNNTYSTKVTFSKVDKSMDEVTEKVMKFTDESITENKDSVGQISSKKLGDVYYVDMNVCLDNAKLDKEISKLKEAIDSGFYKIIIDVRDNSGGNSEACRKLLNAMGMEIPQVGEYVRYSPLAQKANDAYPLTGNATIEADFSAAKPNSKIQLVVLMNAHTVSSGLLMSVYVQDGQLGTIVGQPSINAPSHYGDILMYKLPKSKLKVSISHKYFTRPNPQANQNMLIPDFEPEVGIDSLDFAIEYLADQLQ